MRKVILAISEAEDSWHKEPKDKFTTQQKRYFFAVGAMRDDKEDDGYIQVNYSKIPKKK